jgi:hypothetical protein
MGECACDGGGPGAPRRVTATARVSYYQDTGEDTISRNPDGSWTFRSTRYYPAYPDYDWGLAAGWGWGVSRCSTSPTSSSSDDPSRDAETRLILDISLGRTRHAACETTM